MLDQAPPSVCQDSLWLPSLVPLPRFATWPSHFHALSWASWDWSCFSAFTLIVFPNVLFEISSRLPPIGLLSFYTAQVCLFIPKLTFYHASFLLPWSSALPQIFPLVSCLLVWFIWRFLSRSWFLLLTSSPSLIFLNLDLLIFLRFASQYLQ